MRHQGKHIDKKSPQENNKSVPDVDQEENSLSSMQMDTSTIGISALQQQLTQLQQENELLKHEKNTLQIDKVCLQHKNWELNSRIEDLATHYPQASVLLGKNPEHYQKKGWMRKLFQKRK